MSNFFKLSYPGNIDQWTMELTGNGQTFHCCFVSNELMAELSIYRRYFGMSATPNKNDDFPLVTSVVACRSPLALRAIHEIFKKVVHDTATRLQLEGADFEVIAAHIEQASTHWLRKPS